MNNKTQISYEIVLSTLYDIITEKNTVKLNLITISTDFENGLINACKNIFKNIRHVGCLFHYFKCIRLNLLKIGFYNKNYKNVTEELLKSLSAIPFKIQSNNKLIYEIFDSFYNRYDDKRN